MDTLRQELLQHQAHVVDLAKWKMVLVGAVAATGLGWSGSFAPSPESGVLILFCGGYLAAYADVLIYARLLAIAVLGRFMLEHEDPANRLMQQWQLFGSSVRQISARGISERWAHLASSLVVSIGLPLLALDRYKPALDARLLIPACGLSAVVFVFLRFATARRKLVSNQPLLAPKLRATR